MNGRAPWAARFKSIGIDSWGVDYGLIDPAGNLTEDPICYRDDATEGIFEKIFASIFLAQRFTERTGIQLLEFNTLFQLYAHARAGLPKSGATAS